MNFDLNINNYTTDELLSLFSLNDSNVCELDVTSQETIILDKITYDKNLSFKEKQNIQEFIKTAKEYIIKSITEHVGRGSALAYEDSHHKLQNETKSLYVPSYSSNVYAGIMNPLKRRTIIKNINIDTRFRQRYNYSVSTNFRFELPLILNKVVSMQLKTFEFPSFSFNISDDFGNNYFAVNDEIFTVPNGFYTLTTLIEALNVLMMQSFIPLLFTVLPNQTVSMSLQNEMQNITINFETTKGSQMPLMLKLGWIIGFRKSLYQINSSQLTSFLLEKTGSESDTNSQCNTVTTCSLNEKELDIDNVESSCISESIADLVTLKYCYLCINDYNNNTVNNAFVGALKESILDQNILARISDPTTMSNVSTKSFIGPPREYFGPVSITAFQIQLVDPYGRVLNLQNLDYSFCLSFETIYDL